MDVPTFLELAKGYLSSQDDDKHLEMMCGHARTMMTPILSIWKSLAQQSVRQWPKPDSQYVCVGDSEMYGSEFSDGRHDMLFAHNANCMSTEDDEDREEDAGFILDPRFQGMLLGIASILPSGCVPFSVWDPHSLHYCQNALAFARKLLQNHPIERLVSDNELSVVFAGVECMAWTTLRSIGIKWMRVWYAARAIQRAYRERLRLKRSRMIQFVLVPIIVRNK